MRKFAIDALLGLVVAAGLAAAAPASADWDRYFTWHNSANPSQYLSVGGGAQSSFQGQYLPEGRPVVLWGKGSGNSWSVDQFWWVPSGGGGPLTTSLPDQYGKYMYLSVAGGSTKANAALCVWEPGAGSTWSLDQDWLIYPASWFGAPYDGCYIFINAKASDVRSPYSYMVMDVTSATQGAWTILARFVVGTAWTPSGWKQSQFWCPEGPFF
jgi:hypothetical protein